MYKNKVLFRILLLCICISLVAGAIGIGALATSANSVLQVNKDGSSASLKDGKIQVSLAPDDVFSYNEILDLSTSSKNVPLLNMQFNPNETGLADATRVKIRFTDLYDENNYFTISLNHLTDDWAKSVTYITAGAAHQSQVGVENAGDSANCKVHTDDIYGYGAAVKFSMSGVPGSAEETNLTLYYDYNEKAIYADRESYSSSRQLVVDLDNPDHFPGDLWSGFTSGQVKMTVFASNYQAATCNFSISVLNGSSQFRDSDQSAPIIRVNTGYSQDALPSALVGKPYPIFPATAIDGCDGNVKTTAAVYYENTTGSLTEVATADGKFTPSKEGVYVIKYTAQDLAGNAAAAQLRVNAVVGEGLQVALQGAISETDAGVPVQVLSGIECSGASGDVSYEITARNSATGDQVEIDPQTLSFIPMAEGDWEITVTVRDYVSTVVKSFTVKVRHTTQPQVYGTVGIQDYFVLGTTYQLPTLYGYDFSSGKAVLTAMDVYVKENGSSEKAVANGQYTPAKEGAVTVTYRLTVEGQVCEKSYAATVVKVKTILNTVDLSKYFAVSKGSATAKTASAKITYSFSKDTTLDFVNFVQVKQLSFAFQTGSSKAYNKISIYLTDIITGKQVKLSFNRTADGATFSVNDGVATKLTAGFDDALTLEFSGDTGIALPENGKQIKVEKFLDGSAFTGFTDSVARFAVELCEVSGSSQFVVKTLNGQKLNYATKDSTAPQFIATALSGSVKRGEKLQLTGAFVYDVLDPVATVTLKVTDPNGTVVSDVNGVALDGTQDATKDTAVVLEKIGTYTFLYTTADGKKNTGRHIYTITATDGEAPTITLLDHMQTVKTGETVTIAAAQVQDNLTTDCTVVSYVYDSEGVKMSAANGRFVAEKSGIYTVRYMAFDADGNYAFASYEVTAQAQEVHYISQSVSLGSDLTLHLWGNVPESYIGSLSGTVAYGDATNQFKFSELTPTEDGLYHTQAEMAAAQLTDRVSVTVKHNAIGPILRRQYSIRDYLVTLIEGDYDQATKDLSLELLNMGAWAQKYFDYNTSNLADKGYTITPANAVPAQSPDVKVDGSVSGISFYGTSVRFLSKTAVRFYFQADDAVDGYTFTVDGTEYTPVAKDGMYYIETPGINPQNMSNVITVKVTAGSDTLSVQYAPIWYFVRSYNKAEDDTTKGLMAAAYSYYKAAEVYEYTATSSPVKQPEAPTAEGVYIYLDVLLTTLSNSTDVVDIRFYAHDYVGSVHEGYTDLVKVTAGKKTTVKLNAEKYMVDGVIPEGLGVAVFGGPTWDATLSDGTPDRHTLTISNAWLKGAYEKQIDLNTAEIATGNDGTGYTDANSAGKASIVNDKIVITDGYCYDGHKITLNSDNAKKKTYICLDMQIDTLGGNWTNDIEIRFYPYDYTGTVHDYYQDKVVLKAGTTQTVMLNLNKYLVDDAFNGIGVAVFGGPTWDAKLPDGYTPDRHTLKISNVRLEGGQEKVIDLTGATVAKGNDGTGYTDANGSGEASIVDSAIVISNGFCYDAHKISWSANTDPGDPEPSEPDSGEQEQGTYVVLDMQIDTLSGSWTKDIEMRFYAYDFEGNPHEVYTDKVIFKAGEKITVKLDAEKYLIDGKLTGIGIGIFGGPEWNTQISDGVYDRHTVTISGIRLEGAQSQTIDLSKATCISGTGDTGYTVANGSGVASFTDGVLKITNGFCYDCHKIAFA